MRCIIPAICGLAAEIHCDVSHFGSVIAIAMLRRGELRSQLWDNWFSLCGGTFCSFSGIRFRMQLQLARFGNCEFSATDRGPF